MIQKIIQIGNSIGTIIPQFLNRDIGLKPGDSFLMERKGDKFILSPVKKVNKTSTGVNTKFVKMVDEFINEHEDVLEKLSQR